MLGVGVFQKLKEKRAGNINFWKVIVHSNDVIYEQGLPELWIICVCRGGWRQVWNSALNANSILEEYELTRDYQVIFSTISMSHFFIIKALSHLKKKKFYSIDDTSNLSNMKKSGFLSELKAVCQAMLDPPASVWVLETVCKMKKNLLLVWIREKWDPTMGRFSDGGDMALNTGWSPKAFCISSVFSVWDRGSSGTACQKSVFCCFFFFFFPEICLPYLPLPASNAENSGPDERKSVDSREVDEFEACALA